jgi:nitrogen-specific signal transduction histidine kinase
MTERHRADELQRRTQRMEALGTLAGGIAHDFNNILLAISGNAQIASDDLPKDHAVQRSLLEVVKASGRASALVRRILAFSRPEAPQKQVTDLRPVVEEALTLLRATLPAMIRIETHFVPNVPAVEVDTSQIHQVMMNLVTNAAYAVSARSNGEGGLIQVSVQPHSIADATVQLATQLPLGEYVRLSVSDNGIGMDQATLDRIYDPFFTTKPVGEGTGLGLSVVHGIMQGHGGTVTAYSQPGKGTSFSLYFPVAKRLLPIQKASRDEQPQQGDGKHILYVDDEDSLVFLASRVLRRMGYRVTGLSDPIQALKMFAEKPDDFAAVVTDLSMPTMSGLHLAQKLRAIRPDILIVMTSGYLRPEDREAALKQGISELVLKPDTVQQMGHILARLLQ